MHLKKPTQINRYMTALTQKTKLPFVCLLILFDSMRSLMKLFTITALLVISKVAFAETIRIEFTENDSFSVEVAHIDIGDTIEWLPKNDGYNVKFFVVPEMNSLPATSEIDDAHSVVFTVSGIYLYGCTPHADMGMIALIIVGNDYHNLEALENTKLSRVAKTVLKRLITITQSAPKS
jgi:pseudoazurin